MESNKAVNNYIGYNAGNILKEGPYTFKDNWPIEKLLTKENKNDNNIPAQLDRIEKKLDTLLGSKPVLINGIWR